MRRDVRSPARAGAEELVGRLSADDGAYVRRRGVQGAPGEHDARLEEQVLQVPDQLRQVFDFRAADELLEMVAAVLFGHASGVGRVGVEFFGGHPEGPQGTLDLPPTPGPRSRWNRARR